MMMMNQHKNTNQHKELTDKDTNCILVLGVIGPFRLVRTPHSLLCCATLLAISVVHYSIHQNIHSSKLLQCARVHYVYVKRWVIS